MTEDVNNGPTVLDSLRRLYRAKTLVRVYEGGLLSLAFLIGAIFVSTLLEILANLAPIARGALLFVSVGGFAAVLLNFFFPHLRRYIGQARVEDLMEVALEVGATDNSIKDRLRNAVELNASHDNPYFSDEMTQAYIATTFQNISPAEIERAVRYRGRRSPVIALTISIAALLLLVALSPTESLSAFSRVLDFSHVYARPSPFLITVSPGDAELSRGDTLIILTRVAPRAGAPVPAAVIVNEKYSGEVEFERHQIRRGRDGSYLFALPNIRNSVEYYVAIGSEQTPEYRVNVVDLPMVQNFAVTLSYPSYTGKPRETLQENIGDFSALVGTRAEFSVVSNKELDSAWIAFADGARDRLNISGSRASGFIQIKKSGKYTLRLLDTDSLRNRDPIEYTIDAVRDEYPTCEIVKPGKNVDLTRDMQLPMEISVGDDYGFTKLLLQYKLTSSKFAPAEKSYHSIEIPLPSRAAGQENVPYLWDLSSLNLVPEDVISYHATVFDNDFISGPKSAVSAEYTLRLPSLQEVFASADSEHSDIAAKTEDALNSSDELRDQLDKMAREMKTATKQMSWEQEKKMANTVQRYDSLQKKIEGVKQQLQNMTQKMLENKIISPQTLEKYLELQKALQEINSPEFQDALKKLQQAIQSLNPSMVRQAMQNFQVNEEMLRKSIERTLSLLKRVQIEQKLDELQKSVEQMVSKQESVRKSTAESDSANSAARQRLTDEQKEIGKEMSATEKGAADLKRMMDEFAREMPLKQLASAREQLDKSAASQKISTSASQLAQGEFSSSMSTQKQIASSLMDFQKQLSETQKSMLRNQQRETVDVLRKAQQNLLEISREQEQLRDQAQSTIPNSAESRELAERQNELMQQLGYTAQQMMSLSDKSFSVTPQMGRQIGEAYSQMQQAMNNLQSRSGSTPAPSQSQAMGSLNKAVMGIQSTLQSMTQGQGGGGFPSLMQQLQQLAGKQEGLNALTKELGQNGQLSMQQQGELARLAAQQAALQKSLQQLAQEAQQSQGRDRVLGNLNNVVKEMEQVASDLHNRNISQETIQRQEKILSHLLDATRSIRQRDFDNRRLTKAGTDQVVQSPGELNLSNSDSEEEQQLLKLIRRNFPPEYQRVILRYYKLLKKLPD